MNDNPRWPVYLCDERAKFRGTTSKSIIYNGLACYRSRVYAMIFSAVAIGRSFAAVIHARVRLKSSERDSKRASATGNKPCNFSPRHGARTHAKWEARGSEEKQIRSRAVLFEFSEVLGFKAGRFWMRRRGVPYPIARCLPVWPMPQACAPGINFACARHLQVRLTIIAWSRLSHAFDIAAFALVGEAAFFGTARRFRRAAFFDGSQGIGE